MLGGAVQVTGSGKCQVLTSDAIAVPRAGRLGALTVDVIGGPAHRRKLVAEGGAAAAPAPDISHFNCDTNSPAAAAAAATASAVRACPTLPKDAYLCMR